MATLGVHQFTKDIPEVGLPPLGESVLVGVSGGPDSTLLALAMHDRAQASGHAPFFAHYRHGDSSNDDAALAAAQSLAAHCKRELIVSEILEFEGIRRPEDSEQMALRRMRFAFFERVMSELGIPNLALGHTADDQGETVLMSVLRGRWLQGLAGVPTTRPLESAEKTLFHPLLHVRRNEVESHIREMGFVETLHADIENENLNYSRVQARFAIATLARTEEEGDLLGSLAALSSEAFDLKEAETWMMPFLQERSELEIDEEGAMHFCLDIELPAFFWRTLLRDCLGRLGLNTRQATMARIERVRKAEETRGPQEFGDGVYYRRVGNKLKLWRKG